MRAKDAQELMALHTDYVKSQIAALTDQAKELSKQAAKLAGHASQAEPLGLGPGCDLTLAAWPAMWVL